MWTICLLWRPQTGPDTITLDCRNGTAQDSLQKLRLVLQLCKELGIRTSPARLGNLCIVPLLSWHHSSWDTEPDILGVPHVSALSIADYGACSWPQDGPGTISAHGSVHGHCSLVKLTTQPS